MPLACSLRVSRIGAALASTVAPWDLGPALLTWWIFLPGLLSCVWAEALMKAATAGD